MRESWVEECACGCKTFKIEVFPFGKCGTDHLFICTACGDSLGGVMNDPLDEWTEEK